jgi:hypothetical protein
MSREDVGARNHGLDSFEGGVRLAAGEKTS